MESTPNQSPFRQMKLWKKAIRKNAPSGMAQSSQTSLVVSSIWYPMSGAGHKAGRRCGDARALVPEGSSPFQQVRLIDIGGAPVPEETQDNRQRQACLGRGDRDNEDDKHQSGKAVRMKVHREGDHVDVDGVQHQLNRHQDQHSVPAGEHTVDSNGEEDGG